MFNVVNIEDASSNLHSILINVTNKNAPLKERRIKSYTIQCMNGNVLDSIRHREHLLRTFHASKNDFNIF